MSLKRAPAEYYLDMRDICNLLSVSWYPSEHTFFFLLYHEAGNRAIAFVKDSGTLFRKRPPGYRKNYTRQPSAKVERFIPPL